MADKEKNQVRPMLGAWGAAPFSYWALAASQLCAGAFMPGAAGGLFCVFAFLSTALGFVHKGLTFDEARNRAKKGIAQLPWSQKSSHMAICGATMLVCAMAISQDSAAAAWTGSIGILLAALAGWLASTVPGPASK